MTRILLSRPRLLIGAAIAVAVGLLVPAHDWPTRLILAWDAGIATHLVLVTIMMARADADDLQRRADREDAGAALVLALFAVAALASLGTIAVEVRYLQAESGPLAVSSVALIGATIILSWLFAHVLFGLHYAHDFYAGEDDRRGLRFPGDHDPDYWDFMYFSFNLGAAAQTSDVQVEAPRMRRFVLAHTIISFLFNTGVLALAINVGAGILGGS